jgi:hypothetical protein
MGGGGPMPVIVGGESRYVFCEVMPEALGI